MVESVADLNLERELDNLFAAPVAEFIRRRNELAGLLRSAGRGRDAEQVAKLDKPSAVAWAVNHAVIHGRRDYEALAAASDSLRRAQAQGAPMREPLHRQREAREKLIKRARQALADVGHAATPAVLKKIGGTLLALAGRAIGAAPGRMVRELSPPGFEAFSGTATSTTMAAVKRGEVLPALAEARATLRTAEALRKRVAAAVEETERQRAHAAERVEASAQALARAQAQAAEAEARAAEVAAELAHADAEVAAARQRLQAVEGRAT